MIKDRRWFYRVSKTKLVSKLVQRRNGKSTNNKFLTKEFLKQRLQINFNKYLGQQVQDSLFNSLHCRMMLLILV